MRNFVIKMLVAGAALAGGYAAAQIVSALPFQLQNNTVADATQVMANFNQLLNGVNANGAKNGANSDITSLLGLTTPLAPSVGGTTVYTGGTSGGSANAQTVTPVVPSTFTLVAGSRVVFRAGFTPTANWTLNVAGSGVKNVVRQSQIGPLFVVGGEIFTNQMVEVVYDGTQYQLSGPPVMVGGISDYIGVAAPVGYLFADGSCVSQTTYAALFTVASTTWGSCGAGLFALPDLRGRITIAKDAGANRVTTAGSGCDGATLATGCGAQNRTIAQAALPNVNFTLTINDTRTWATTNAVYILNGVGPGGVGGGANAIAGAEPITNTGGTITGTAASGGAGTALVTLDPALIVNKVIKY